MIAFIYSVLNFSLADISKVIWTGAILLIGVTLAIHPFTKGQTEHVLSYILEFDQLLIATSIFQFLEAILVLTLVISEIHNGDGVKKITGYLNWISKVPFLVFFISVFFIQAHFYINLDNISFWNVIAIFSLIAVLLFTIFVWIAKKIKNNWKVRNELKLLIVMLQLLIAMFLPLLVQGAKVPYTTLIIDSLSILLITAALFIFSLIGIFKYHITKQKVM